MAYRVVFDGGYTLWSAGDDAPLAFLTTELRKRFNDTIEFTVFARHPNKDFDRFYGVTTVQNFEYQDKEASREKWFRGLNFADDRGELKKLVNYVADADLLVLGAGNFMTEVSMDVLRGHFARFAIMTLIAEISETPCLLFGLSANRLVNPWSVKVATWMLRHASNVTFRDYEAVRNLQNSGVKLGVYEVLPDPALGAPSVSSVRTDEILKAESIAPKQTARLAIAPRDLSWRGGQEQYESLLTEVIDAWCSIEGHDVIFVPQCSYNVDTAITDDRFIAARIREKTAFANKVYIINGLYPSWDIESLYLAADVALTTRLHGSVFAAKCGVPPVGISYEDKVKGFFEQIGLQDWCMGLDVRTEVLIDKLLSALKQREELSERIKARTLELKTDLHRYVDIAEGLIRHHGSA